MKCITKRQYISGFLQVNDINLSSMLQNPRAHPKDKNSIPVWRFDKLINENLHTVDQLNYKSTHAMIIEFDGKCTIQKIEDSISEFAYAIHTTYSHKADDHHFRVIFPLDREYDYNYWKSLAPAIKLKWPGLDASVKVNYQAIPVLPENPLDYYWSIHAGRRFGEVDLLDELEEIKFREQYLLSKDPPKIFLREGKKMNIDFYISEHVIRKLDTINWFADGSGRYNSMCSFCGTWKTACKHNGFSPRDIVDAVYSYNMPDKYKKQAKSMVK